MSQWPFSIPAELAWIKGIRVGDVLRSRSGKLRIVRYVHHWGPSLPKTSVVFTIQHCSWTTRPYTSYNGNDLRQMGFQPTRKNVNWLLQDKFDRLLSRDFGARTAADCTLHCCDVRGIP